MDVTGIWLGTFAPEGGTSGTVILDLTQSGASITGAAELLGTSIPDGNVGVRVTGTVSGNQVDLRVNGSSDRFLAAGSSGTLAGTISSGVAATWTATLVETHSLSFGTTQDAGYLPFGLLAAQDGAVWLEDNGHIEGATFADPINSSYCGLGFDRCGTGFVCSQQGGAIYLVEEGNTVWDATQLSSTAKTAAITCDSTSIWAERTDLSVPDGSNLIQQLDMSGTPIGDGFYVPGTLSGLTFDGTDLWVLESFPPVLLRISTGTGQVLAAYQVPEALALSYEILAGLTWDGTTLWTLFTTEDATTHVASTVAVQLLEAAP